MLLIYYIWIGCFFVFFVSFKITSIQFKIHKFHKFIDTQKFLFRSEASLRVHTLNMFWFLNRTQIIQIFTCVEKKKKLAPNGRTDTKHMIVFLLSCTLTIQFFIKAARSCLMCANTNMDIRCTTVHSNWQLENIVE